MRPQKACINCNRRKQKCDLEQPCSRCTKLEVQCIFAPPRPELSEEDKLLRAKEKALKKANSKDPHPTKSNKSDDFKRLKRKYERVEQLFGSVSLELPKTKPNNITLTPKSNSDSFSNSTTSSPTNPSNSELLELITPESLSQLSVSLMAPSEEASLNEAHLVNIYFKYHSRNFPFMNETRVAPLVYDTNLSSIILIRSICAFTLPICYYLMGKPDPLGLNNNIFYKSAKHLIRECRSKPDLNLIQALLILLHFEQGNANPIKASWTLAEMLRLAQVLGLDKSDIHCQPEVLTLIENEKQKTWLTCMTVDFLNSIFFSNPTVIHYESIPLIAPYYTPVSLNCAPFSETYQADKELEHLRSFYYLARLKYEWHRLNAKVRDKEIALSAVEVEIKNLLEKIFALEFSSDPYFPQVSSTLICQSNVFEPIQNPLHLSFASLNTFRLSLITITYFLYSRVLQSYGPSFATRALRELNTSQQHALTLYELIEATEKSFKFHLGNRMSMIYYATHFTHLLSLEWIQMPFANECSQAGKTLVEACKLKMKNADVFWPILTDRIVQTCFTTTYAPAI